MDLELNSEENKNSKKAHKELSNKIIDHVHTALKNVRKYTPTAMDDVILSIRELCDAKCVELLLFSPHSKSEESSSSISEAECSLGGKEERCSGSESLAFSFVFLETLLSSYVSHPKTPPGRTVDQIPWKSSVAGVFTDFFKLSLLFSSSSSSSNPSTLSNIDSNIDANFSRSFGVVKFTAEFFEICCADMLLLYKSMGTILDPDGTYVRSVYFFIVFMHYTFNFFIVFFRIIYQLCLFFSSF